MDNLLGHSLALLAKQMSHWTNRSVPNNQVEWSGIPCETKKSHLFCVERYLICDFTSHCHAPRPHLVLARIYHLHLHVYPDGKLFISMSKTHVYICNQICITSRHKALTCLNSLLTVVSGFPPWLLVDSFHPAWRLSIRGALNAVTIHVSCQKPPAHVKRVAFIERIFWVRPESAEVLLVDHFFPCWMRFFRSDGRDVTLYSGE